MLAKMSAFKEATVYKVGQSYLGKDVWAMDLMPPIEASHWSQAKQTTLKPTIVYSARQHANEVSSTSHVLKMAELLLTDPDYHDKLKKVNVVVPSRSRTRTARSSPTTCRRSTRLHAARRLSRIARRDVTYRAVGRAIRSIRKAASGRRSGARGCPTSSSTRTATRRTNGCSCSRNTRLGAQPLDGSARLLDDARLVDAGIRLARRCALPAAQGRQRQDPRHDHRVHRRGAGDSRAQRARLRSLPALRLRFRRRDLQLDFTNGVLVYTAFKGNEAGVPGRTPGAMPAADAVAAVAVTTS